ncbi:glycosyl hydrolase 115 family protein [Paraflavitalea pollutisoli]|uniref:glycosyl hydrolase 115 family protein n=1 Tax=Paraflavitalea pollutisoli TaxID=3034143 RepID=UPI0023EC4054|nr:glycosyl hydrolase 115 family protein [Paraflavitalea sp. H1-2-19X]
MKKLFLLLCLMAGAGAILQAQPLVSPMASPAAFPLVAGKHAATIYVDADDYPVVRKAATLLQEDILRVTGIQPAIVHEIPAKAERLILIGTAGKAAILDRIKRSFSTHPLTGKWEAYQWSILQQALPGIRQTLVIAGSDRRGTAYGVMELSKAMGVSPWYWWADVPVKQQPELYLANKTYAVQAPAVKYRGIFINDEAPALSGWSKEKFGGFNHAFYEKVFELMLRLRSNYLWPAMWGNAFYDDDSLNIKSADEYAIVIGTSHHEPLMRAHDEWRRYGKGKWNYDSNAIQLKNFWRGGMQRATNEKIVSVGMRGDGDEPMSRETATALLERIVSDQRQIIADVTNKPANETPQLWALYKEVQDYYDKGMRVPDDVTLLLCDDNWGNIRRLPALTDKPRQGGYGIYYHFDYVGGPRNYKWINTNNIARVWEQMHLAWEHKVRDIWIVNVGDIKPMEFPISFFIDYAWDPTAIGPNDLQRYTEQWVAQQFGAQQAKPIAKVLSQYAQFISRRKPELLDTSTFHPVNYREAEIVNKDFDSLLVTARKIKATLKANQQDGYYQLVLHPIEAMANLYQLYYAVAKNNAAATCKDWPQANLWAGLARKFYQTDSMITVSYHTMGDGKWNHMMDQTHIGYTYWQQPPVNKMPAVIERTDGTKDKACAMDLIPAPRTAVAQIPASLRGNYFYEQGGYVSMEAAHYTQAINSHGIQWTLLPNHGRTGDAITPFPVTASTQQPGGNSPHLQYEFYTYSESAPSLQVYCSPTLNLSNSATGLQYAVSIDDEAPQLVSINKDDNVNRTWDQWVANNIIVKTTKHALLKPGKHTLKYWMVDPAVVLQKLVIDLGGLKPSYLGPPETRRIR